MMPRRLALIILVLALKASATTVAAEPDDQPDFGPGQVTRIDRDDIGYKGHFLVYLPEDYTPDRSWPVIFSYHGLGGNPEVSTFRAITQGRGLSLIHI